MKSMIVFAVAGLAASAAVASPLVPGGSVSPILPFPNFVVLGTPVTGIYSNVVTSAGHFTADLRSRVYTNCVDNPWGLNAYTFVYGLFNDAGSADALNRFTVNGFGSFLTDVGYDPSSAGPGYVDAFENTRQLDGDSLGWSFVNLGQYSRVAPGEVSRVFVVHTNATTFALNTAAIINGGIADTFAYSPVPTPGTAALLGLGVLAAGRRRR